MIDFLNKSKSQKLEWFLTNKNLLIFAVAIPPFSFCSQTFLGNTTFLDKLTLMTICQILTSKDTNSDILYFSYFT